MGCDMKSSYVGNKLKTLIMAILCIVFVVFVIIGQKTVSYNSFFLQLIGLVGLLILVYIYNRQYQ